MHGHGQTARVGIDGEARAIQDRRIGISVLSHADRLHPDSHSPTPLL